MASHFRGPVSVARADPNYGKGIYSIASEEPGEDLVERLREVFRSPSYQPPLLPSVALELLAISRNPDVQLRHVLHLLEQDTLIAGGVLQLAQSSVHQTRGPIRTLDQAVTLLGLRVLADLCLQASLKARVFRAPGYEPTMNQLRRHSAATAQIARQLAGFASFPDDYAYTCGLMHDAGIAACLLLFGDVPRGTPVKPLEIIEPAIRDVHEEASETLALLWRLPDDVRLVMGKHHRTTIDGRVHPLIAAIAMAEALAAEAGAPPVADVQVESPEALAARLALPAPSLVKLRAIALQVVAEVDRS
jgi:HD-like signal output (HDOD) protein